MAKLKHLWLVYGLLLSFNTFAQPGAAYSVHYTGVDTDSATLYTALQLKQSFATRNSAVEYIAGLPSLLQEKGYIAASVDSVYYDSARAAVHLFLGASYKWVKVITQERDEDVLQAIRWQNAFAGAPLNIGRLQEQQQRILNYLEESGHPFAKILLDSMVLDKDGVSGVLKIDRGPVYKIDSIRVYGGPKLNNEFLQHYLEIPNGSLYNKKKLQDISKKLAQLTYIQEERPSNITMLGTGSVLNLYLKEKRSSQINVLVGFLPNSNTGESKKFLITGEANILLHNSLSAGETIGLNWQQLQQKSPKLNLLYEHPYIFHSQVGLKFVFDMFRKDSTFLNINMNLGAAYKVGEYQSTIIFIQKLQTIVNGVDTAYVLQNRRLPPLADVSSLGLGVTYTFNNTDYPYNALRGNELSITVSAGNKTIKKNSEVLQLKDPAEPGYKFESLYDTVKLNGYQFQAVAAAAHYFLLGKQSAFKTAINAGMLQSNTYFINELFRIGGYRLLRGFDEESQYVSHYAIGTAELRYLIGRNSNFFTFVNGGWARHPLAVQTSHTYIGTGVGLALETKAGIFNLVWAVGKRDDTNLNLRQSKVHLGFINYF